jgi:hypothetical protein
MIYSFVLLFPVINTLFTWSLGAERESVVASEDDSELPVEFVCPAVYSATASKIRTIKSLCKKRDFKIIADTVVTRMPKSVPVI